MVTFRHFITGIRCFDTSRIEHLDYIHLGFITDEGLVKLNGKMPLYDMNSIIQKAKNVSTVYERQFCSMNQQMRLEKVPENMFNSISEQSFLQLNPKQQLKTIKNYLCKTQGYIEVL